MTQTLEEIRDEFEDKVFLIAEVDGEIVGSVRAFVEDGTCYIGRLVVHPDSQNQGIGTKLMGEIEKEFSAVRRYELFTGHRSENSLHLYRKCGYRILKTETITEDLKLVYMEKD